MIELRPHHLLCLVGWRGHGYDRAFTDNFNRLADSLDRDSEIKLVEGADEICACCPRLNASACRADEYGGGNAALLIDRRVLENLGLQPGEIYRFDELSGLVREKITAEVLSDICAGCGWLARGWCAEAFKLEGHHT